MVKRWQQRVNRMLGLAWALMGLDFIREKI